MFVRLRVLNQSVSCCDLLVLASVGDQAKLRALPQEDLLRRVVEQLDKRARPRLTTWRAVLEVLLGRAVGERKTVALASNIHALNEPLSGAPLLPFGVTSPVTT